MEKSGPQYDVGLTGILTDLRAIETRIASLRHRLLHSVPEPGRPSSLMGETENTAGTLVLEILQQTGIAVDDANPVPSPVVIPVVNQTGEEVILGSIPAIGQIAIVIPDGGTRAIQRVPGKDLVTEFVEYETFNPCFPGPPIPGQICIDQVYRHLVQRAADRPSGDALPVRGKIELYRNSSGGFGLRS